MMSFEPQLYLLPYFQNDGFLLSKLKNNIEFGLISAKLKVYDYALAKESLLNRYLPYPYFPCPFVNWDNSPRRGKKGTIFLKGTPDLFEKYLMLNYF